MNIHLPTLTFTSGLGNLIFAILVFLYIKQSRSTQKALKVWCSAKVLLSAGFLFNFSQIFLPHQIPPVVGNVLQITGIATEFAAYCLLLNKPSWLNKLWPFCLISLVVLLSIAIAETSQGPRLLWLSTVIGSLLFGVSILLFSYPQRSGLIWVIGIVNLLAATSMFLRVYYGIFIGELVRFQMNWANFGIYFMAYITLIINGFGFLLLAKRQDDEELTTWVQALRENEAIQRTILSTASHEFRTPLAQIQASLDSLRIVGHDLPIAVLQRVDNMRYAAKRMSDLADSLISQEQLLEPRSRIPQQGEVQEVTDYRTLHFLELLAHEFRNHSAMIKSSIDSLLLLHHELPPTAQERLQRLRVSSWRLNDLTEDLLQQHRFRAEVGLDEAIYPVELWSLLNCSINHYQLLHPHRKIELIHPSHNISLTVDAALFAIAIDNLIDNALSHSQVDNSPITVMVQEHEDRVEIAVKDLGSGISDAKKGEVFKRYVSGTEEKTRGLGLNIVWRIVQLHHGKIEVFDNVPSGTVMQITLPLDGKPAQSA